ncbi:MAG: M14 family metallopeptidase [Deltaproteobacteria bacterium]|nr:M14 family metallopeptidase [Deltaproteobacteria bacterium]
MAFVAALDARGDPRLHVTSFGTSPQGRDLPLLVLSTAGVRSPEAARDAGRPVVLMLDGIHPGEVEGKEASLALVRDVLDGRHEGWLDAITLLVVPLFNPDGNDALDPANRRLELPKLSGQPGPVVGTRTQSHGINLNRDYLRQAAPEMRLLQQHVCIPWAPDLTIDNHATNGSVHRMDMTVDVPHTVESGRAEPIVFMRSRVVPDVIAAVRKRGIESGWYGNFVEDERVLDARGEVDPAGPVGEGWMTYPHHPRFGSNYRGLTNRLDLLLECYSYLSFERRVETASAWQEETLRWVAAHADDVRQVVASIERPPDHVAVRYRLDAFDAPISVPTRTPRTMEGAPTDVSLRYFGRFVGTHVVERPAAYLVPPKVAAHLRLHGLTVSPGVGRAEVEVPHITSLGTEGGRAILEAAKVGDVEARWEACSRDVPPGWSRVETDQPLGSIAVYLCEPESDDGAIENGLVDVPAVGAEFPIWRMR